MRSPEEAQMTAAMDLFPFTKARMRETPFRTPHYGSAARTPEILQREMLSCVFGWHDDILSLMQDELSRHRPGSASAVLLAKWLGEMDADNMAAMVGSESMTSSDWMLLALNSIGQESQKKVGEAFVQRLLEKGDIHPAVAILLGLGEDHDAIEVYFSLGYWLEAVLLTCLKKPGDWGRQSYLVRKWGEALVQSQQAELAVRCFSCTSIETSEPYFSPRAQDAVYTAQQQRLNDSQNSARVASPPLSPPSRSGSGRLAAMHANSSLTLITTFGDKSQPVQTELQATPLNMVASTPIAQSALSPGAWPHSAPLRNIRDPSSARTATPGGFNRRKRLPSKDDIERAKQEAADMKSPTYAVRNFSSREPSASRRGRQTSGLKDVQEPATAVPAPTTAIEPQTALRPTVYDALSSMEEIRDQSPSAAFAKLRERSQKRGISRDLAKDGALTVEIVDTKFTDNFSPSLTGGTAESISTAASNLSGRSRGRAIENYISSVEQARENARRERTTSRIRSESRKRDESRGARGTSRKREQSSGRGRKDVRYIKPAKRSPNSPKPMSPAEIAQATQAAKAEPATTDDENYYKAALSPIESHKSLRSTRSDGHAARHHEIPEDLPEALRLPPGNDRGRSSGRAQGSAARSPSLPLSPERHENEETEETEETQSDGMRFRIRARSHERNASDDLQARRAASRGRRDQSQGRRAEPRDDEVDLPIHAVTSPIYGPKSPTDGVDSPVQGLSSLVYGVNSPINSMGPPTARDPLRDIIEEHAEHASESSVSMSSSNRRQPRGLSRKQLAAKELEERRMSLARRPSAPQIPMPGELVSPIRPGLAPRSHTELGDSPISTQPPISRSQSVDPDAMSRANPKLNKPVEKLPPMGLPATPRAMRHPRYMGADSKERDDAPPVPEIPGTASELSSLGGGSSLSQVSQVTNSYLSSNAPSTLPSELKSTTSLSMDQVPPLLPSSVFGQKPAAYGPPRAASAPPENNIAAALVHPAYKSALPASSHNRRLSTSKGQVRKISPPDAMSLPAPAGSSITSSIDEALSSVEQSVVVVSEISETAPHILPELQHLAGPPPPPPVPTLYSFPSQAQDASGVININLADMGDERADAFDESQLPKPMERVERPQTASPTQHRSRGSVSDTFGSRWRGFGDRMRSSSRNRTKSPIEQTQNPYETKLPPFPVTHQRRESWSRAGAKSPYEQAMAVQSQEQIPPPPPPSGYYVERLNETTIPPKSLPPSRSGSALGSGGYRNPKEIRANMPPDQLQQGAFGAFL